MFKALRAMRLRKKESKTFLLHKHLYSASFTFQTPLTLQHTQNNVEIPLMNQNITYYETFIK